MEEALKLIISKSWVAVEEALYCLLAIKAQSPAAQTRYNHCVRLALSDPAAEWTAAERELLAEHIAVAGPASRDFMLRVRLTQAERSELQLRATAAGLSLSEYTRRMLKEK